MAFKREEIRNILGDAYTDDIGTKLVALHRGVVDPLKDDLDNAKRDAERYKKDAEKLTDVQKELDDLKKDDWKAKAEKAEKDLKDYKQKVVQDAQAAKIKDAYRKLLIEEKISEKALDSVLNATDYSSIKLKDDGTLDGVEDLKKNIAEKWGGFIVEVRKRGAGNETPPPGGDNGGKDTSIRDMMKNLHESKFGAAPKE